MFLVFLNGLALTFLVLGGLICIVLAVYATVCGIFEVALASLLLLGVIVIALGVMGKVL